MIMPNDHGDQSTGAETNQERDLLKAYRELDAAARVLIWCTLLTEVARQPAPAEEATVRDSLVSRQHHPSRNIRRPTDAALLRRS